MIKKLLEYLPIFTICLLFFGYCNLFYYYKVFNIEIYSFITTTDILLSFLPIIVLITSMFYATILIQLYETIKKTSSNIDITETNDKPTKKQKIISWIRKNIYWIVCIYYLPWLILSLILQFGFHYKPYELTDINMFIDFIFLTIIYIGIALHERRSKILENPTIIAVFLVIFISVKIGSYRSSEALKIKDGKGNYKKDHVSFQYQQKSIITNDTLVYVGETSSYLFLYNRNDSTTKVYPFSKIEDLTIK
jgi:hypothetical protein